MPQNLRRYLSIAVLLGILALPVSATTYEPSPILEVGLQNSDQIFVGEDNGDWAGYFASPAGDVNGDGLGDLLIGAPIAGDKVCPYPVDPCPGLPKGEGVTYLILGQSRDQWDPSPVDLGNADASFIGCEVNSMTGRQIYTAGDVNGDGYDDFLISGWKCGFNYTGKAFLFLGRPNIDWGMKYPAEQADASFLGEQEEDYLSYYTATAGDVNGDGYDDFLITSTHNDEAAVDAGQTYLFLGRKDIDWGTDFPVSQADASFLGEAEYDRLGRAAVGVGDVNADGYDDFMIASISSDDGEVDAGESYLFLGRPGDAADLWGMDFPVSQADASFVGEGIGDESGRRVAGAGDVNGDGYDDFMIGSARNDHGGEDAGIGYLMLGRAAADWGTEYPLATADASFTGEENQDQAGRRLSGAGDVNDDGFDDFIIGAPHNSRGGFAAGSAYLLYGKPEADWGIQYPLRSADVVYVGKVDVGSAGYDSGGLGDFDGDGIDDFFIAAYGGRNDGVTPGENYVLLGSSTPQVLGFVSDVTDGSVAHWYRFTGAYWDPNGFDNIAEVQLTLGRNENDDMGFGVMHDPISNTLYLRDEAQTGWLGPCTPGEETRLTNGTVSLDCRGTRIRSLGTGTLEVTWRIGWERTDTVMDTIAANAYNITMNSYLTAEDIEGHDSGLQTGETWNLVIWRAMMPIVLR